MHVVTLLAQPRDKHPLARARPLRKGQLKTIGRGTFGLVWLTDFFAAFWDCVQDIDAGAKLRLRESGFDEMNWAVAFRFAGFKARLTARKYKGFYGVPRNCYLELKLASANPNDLRMFLRLLAEKFEKPPWVFNNWNKLEAGCGYDREAVVGAWSQAMDREISAEDTSSGWSLPFLGGAKTEDDSAPETDTSDIEVLTDSEGQEHRFRHYGILEVEGEEYAVMAPVDGDDDVLDVDILHVAPDGGYEAIEDEELFSALAEAAQEHLAA